MSGNKTGKNDFLVGIDFGACNIKMGTLLGERFKALKISKNEGFECPNFLHYKKLKEGGVERVLGVLAKKAAPNYPADVISRIKRKLEEKNWQYHIPALDMDMTATDIAGEIFTLLRQKLTPDADQDVVAAITVPVSFSNAQIARLRLAAEKAGFTVRSVISESFAALFALNELEDLEDGLHLVFDFGGSTLDVSVFRVRHAEDGLEIRELAASGLRIGGLDIDQAIQDLLLNTEGGAKLTEKYRQYGEEIMKQSLLLDSEGWKLELFEGYDDYVNVQIDPELNLTRDMVNGILDRPEFRGKILDLLDSLFEELEEGRESCSRADVVKIWPFGGSCRIPYVRQLLEEYFSPAVFCADDFDPEDSSPYMQGVEDNYLAVAAGAARYLKLQEKPGLSTASSLPFHVGLMLNGRFKTCLEKNSMPGEKSRALQLPLDWLEQNGWRLPVYQVFATGDNRDPIYMGEFSLDRKLYEPDEFPIVQMNMTPAGDLELRVYQRQLCHDGEEYDINPIEEFLLSKGSSNEPE